NNVTITQATQEGIHITMDDANSQNLTITNTQITNNNLHGIYLKTRGILTLTNNTITHNGDWGLWILGQNNPTVTINNNTLTNNNNGLYLQGVNEGTFQDNQLINNTIDDLYATADTNNIFTRLTLGLTHPTTVSFNYLNGIIMNGVESAPADPSGLVSIGKYVDIQGLGSTTVNLTVHYNATDVAGKNENGLKMFHYGNSWSELSQPNGVNTADEYVYAYGINSFSTFAPLADKFLTTLELPDITGYRNEEKEISATLKDSNGNGVAGKEIKFSVDGTEVGHANTNASGVASITYSLTESAGVYSLSASFAGDDDYKSSTNNTATLTVNKRPTILTVNNTSGINGQDVELAARLTTGGIAVSGATITFTVGGNTYTATTGTDGWATVTYSITQIPGDYNIGAEFTETGYYLGSTGSGTLTVFKNNTNIVVTYVTGINGQNIQLQATLTNQDGTPLTGKTVNFQVNGTPVGSVLTNDSGIATLIYTITQTPGTHTINATFNGDGNYNSTYSIGILTVHKNATNLTVLDVTGANGQNVTLKATLTNQDGTPLSGKTIQFTVNGTNAGSATTNSNGVATHNYQITQNQGTYIIGATFTEDSNYNSTTGSGTLTVEDKSTKLVVSDVQGRNGTVVDLNATLTDSDGNPLVGQTIYFQVDGTQVGSANTNGNGVASVPYTIDLTGGTHTIQVDFPGNADYQATTGTGQLKVPLSSLYIRTTASKTNPTLGETITITFKLGNDGPDTAENVVFTLVIPDGMEFINASTDQGTWTYNDTTRTITWNLGNVTVGDPYLWAIVRVLNNGNYVLMPLLSTDTYDPNLNNNIQPLTISVQAVSQESETVVNERTVGMQNTGAPIGLLVMAVLMLLGGILVPKRKK
ncbi:Ig-like domain repeat protein, partial [Methanobacterium sp.]|uniref:Ig-like domain repeat protein n=1 Tax=Methanobacterium sp. TaxID=2164 RepID=UPI002ABCD45D